MKNKPKFWIEKIPYPKESDHKYSRGQVAVLGGEIMTGAACLSADAAAKIGAGLVTIIAKKNSLPIYKCFKPYIIARDDMDMKAFVQNAKLKGRVCPIIGPGLGDKDYRFVRSIILLLLLEQDIPMIIDADGLNAFEGRMPELLSKLHKNVILTPHDGEFKRMFPNLAKLLDSDREQAIIDAANLSNAVIVLKGSKTIIATKGRDIIVNNNASTYLATAGSGDVLSGVLGGLLTQGMSAFDAACAGVWMHGRASQIIGAGLVASDLIEEIPKVLKEMLGISKKVG